MIVPFPPGGVADTVGRPVAEALARQLKQPVVVENKAGAGGGIGMALRRQAPSRRLHRADEPVVDLHPARGRQDPEPRQMFTLDQLKPIARFTADPTVLVVRADSALEDAGRLHGLRQGQPRAHQLRQSGNYGTMHVPMEMLKATAGAS
jgi:tripartite-type tricarboxylate transporter receptor subunit TctC